MPKRTNPFQNLSASIMAVMHAPDYLVKESVLEANPKTGLPREIDILITEVKNPTNKIMVECRDWKTKQNVKWIDELDGKARSLQIKRVIAVSSSGFHTTTLKEAKARKIETIHLADAEEADIKNWLFKIKEFGFNVDFEPVIRKVNLVSPNGINTPDLSKINPSDIFLLNLNDKKKIPLSDYLKGLVTDPKIIEHVRINNADEATTHYDYTIPCDSGVGYGVDGETFIPLISIIFSIDSARRTYKVPMRHMRAGEHKILVGDVDNHNRLVLEEKEGQLVVMIESHVEKHIK
ncbi:restriction endonuclease [Candidatus Saccharibacteria bacterium]|nr:restriction endonuclease [Candidatus Saccharibacteria bacterium]